MTVDLLTDTLYARFRDLLAQRSGLAYPEHKRADLAHGLRMALAAGAYPDLETLYAEAALDSPAWALLVEHLTIGETYFFRNTPQFDALRGHILPELLQRRRQGATALRSLRIWSAGCATGEEPYSLAMLLHELVPDLSAWFVTILGTDINAGFLARARQATYGAWSFRETSSATQERWFTRDGARWRLRPEAQRMVTFAPLNLVASDYPSVTSGTMGLDLILCRNVTIYFDEATTRRIVDRLYEALAPGGWLIVGHAEPQSDIYQRFERHSFPNTIVYRKPESPPLFAAAPLVLAPAMPATPAPAPPRPRTAEAAPLRSTGSLGQPAAARDQAQAELRRVLLQSPHDPRALCELARLEADAGDLATAQQRCGLARRHHPLYRDAYAVSAQIHEQQREWELAVAAFRHAVFLDPQFVPGILGMGRAYAALGNAGQAQRCYRNALKQLSRISPATTLAELDGATAGEIAQHVEQLLAQG